MKNLIFVIADSLRWDYFNKVNVTEGLNWHISKCHSAYPTTSEAVPILVTGNPRPEKKVVDKINIGKDWMWLTDITSQTLFDVFEEKGYATHYVNLDPLNVDVGNSYMPSFFPSFPTGQTVNQFFNDRESDLFFLMLHDWTIHYPYGLKADGGRAVMRKKYSVGDFGFAYHASVEYFKTMILPQIIGMAWKDTEIVLTADHGENLGELVGDTIRTFHSPPTNEWLRDVPFASSMKLTDKKVIEQEEIFGLLTEWVKQNDL